MAEVIQKLVRKRKKRILISFDWTKFREFHTLMAAARIKGRSVPLLWASSKEWKFLRSQNSLEEGLLRLLHSLIPESIRVVILADRGFGRAEWAAVCQELGFDSVVRIKPNVTVAAKRDRGLLSHYPVKKGIAHVLRDVRYRADARVTHLVVIRWRFGLPKKRDQPWYLMTNLEGRAEWSHGPDRSDRRDGDPRFTAEIAETAEMGTEPGERVGRVRRTEARCALGRFLGVFLGGRCGLRGESVPSLAVVRRVVQKVVIAAECRFRIDIRVDRQTLPAADPQ